MRPFSFRRSVVLLVVAIAARTHAQPLFEPEVTYPTGQWNNEVVTGDFNNDSWPDLAVTHHTADSMSILFNNENGTFAAPVAYATGNFPSGIGVGDFNGDTWPDLAVASFAGNVVQLFVNDGDGTFTASTQYPVGRGPVKVWAGDLDADTWVDLAVSNAVALSNNISILLNNGDGTFAPAVNYPAVNAPWGIAGADVDGNGSLDLAVANNSSTVVSLFRNNGDGTFAPASVYSVEPGPKDVFLFDVDGSNGVDIVSTHDQSFYLSVLLNDGNGSFAPALSSFAFANAISAVALDMDADGRIDIGTLAPGNFPSDGAMMYCRNMGDGTFLQVYAISAPDRPYSVCTADFDNSGWPDVAIAKYEIGQIGIHRSLIIPSCCLGITGNLDGDPGDLTDGSDLQALVDFVFFSIPLTGTCEDEKDVTRDGLIDGSDLQQLVDYIFFVFPAIDCPLGSLPMPPEN